MAKFSAIAVDTVEPSPGYVLAVSATGVVWSKLVSPADYSLAMAISELEDGAVITWSADHGDEGIYVIEGQIEVDGHRCPTDGAVIVESGVATSAHAVGRTVVAHCAPTSAEPPADGLYGPAKPDSHAVHVVGDQGWFRSGARENVVARWFSDSTCPTCRIALFHVRHDVPGSRDTPHHHTQDEIIYILGGEVRLGARSYGAGTALAIPANLRYSITGGPSGWQFLNYRRDVSVQHYAGDREPELEGGIAREGIEVADFR